MTNINQIKDPRETLIVDEFEEICKSFSIHPKSRIARYLKMFNHFEKPYASHFVGAIRDAISIFKKDNIIIWHLKNTRKHAIAYLEHQGRILSPKLAHIAGRWMLYVKPPSGKFDHFYSLGIKEIDNYQYQNQTMEEVLKDFNRFEKDYFRKFANTIKIKKDDNVLIDCGDDWFWVHINKSSCREEGKAMGHCGNAGSNDPNETILSLRKKKTIQGTKVWEPHLTFVRYEPLKYLTETKGKANKSPSEKYHPQIIKLLESKHVDGIMGGGYLCENNFSIYDLKEEDWLRLVKEKPNLKPLNQQGWCDNKDEALAHFFHISSDYEYNEGIEVCVDSGEIIERIKEDRHFFESYQILVDIARGWAMDEFVLPSDDEIFDLFIHENGGEIVSLIEQYIDEDEIEEFLEEIEEDSLNNAGHEDMVNFFKEQCQHGVVSEYHRQFEYYAETRADSEVYDWECNIDDFVVSITEEKQIDNIVESMLQGQESEIEDTLNFDVCDHVDDIYFCSEDWVEDFEMRSYEATL